MKDAAGVVMAVIVAFALVAAGALAWVFLVAPHLISQDAQNLRNSYGSQQAHIDGARQAVAAASVAAPGGQKVALTTQACSLIADLPTTAPVPSDLAAFRATNC